MSPARTVMTHAAMLAAHDSNDDKIVHMLTADVGRVGAVARKGRQSMRRFGAHIEPLTVSEVAVRLRPDNDLALLERAATVEAHGVMKGDLTRLSLGSVMSEVVMHLVPEHVHEPALFALLVRAWGYLNDPRRPASEDVLLLFELKALAISGLMPEPSAVAGLDAPIRETFGEWLAGHWTPMPTPAARRAGARYLEGLVCGASGRELKSRRFLEQTMEIVSP